MDNDNKVNKMTEQRHKDVLLFLQDELVPLKQKNNFSTYNLEKEYAKTKKNKSPFVFLLLLACLGVVALVSFVLSKSIEKTNREITVDLEEFEDVNLKNLLDTVSRTQSQYEAAVKNKATLEGEKQSELSAEKSKHDNDILVVTSMNLSNKKEEQKQIQEIDEAYEARVKEIEAKYEAPLAAAAAEVEEFKSKLDEYDQTKLAVAQEQEKALDSQRQLQEIERKQLVDRYEARIENLQNTLVTTRKENDEAMKNSLKTVSAKYQAEIDALDPIIKDAKANEIMGNKKSAQTETRDFSQHDMYGEGAVEDVSLKTKLENLKKLIDDYKLLDKIASEIPFKNSMGDVTATMDKIFDEISFAFADISYSLYNDREGLKQEKYDLELELAKYTNDVEAYQKLTGADKEEFPAESETENDEKTEFYTGVLAYMNSNAIVQSAKSRETIYIYVHPDIQAQITYEGLPAEIKAKKTVKGKVIKLSNGRFVFVPNRDKNDNPIAFEIDGLVGTPVKITVAK